MASDILRPRWAALLNGFSWSIPWSRTREPALQPVPGEPTDERDRRQSERFFCELQATCRVVALMEFQPVSARVRDMSAGGVGLQVPQPLEVGSFLILELADGNGIHCNRLCVKVMHATVEGSATWRVGCAIVRESVEVREPETEGRLILSP